MGIPTPDTRHLRKAEYATLHELRPTICVEIGSGSGCVSAFLGQVLSPYGALVLSTDINPAANLATRETAAKLAPCLSAFDQCRTRFVQALDERLHGKVDVLVFNPPYVVTPPDEVNSTIEAAAWAGGVHGRQVLDELLPQLPLLLSPGGRFYLVAIEQNKPDDIIAALAQSGLAGQRVLSRKAHNEHLTILRFVKTN
ncbi:HemK methyltransferase member 2, partial [Coemansia sp. RSA 2673]